MKRRTLDLTLATVGLVMAVVLAIASALLLFAASFTNTTITDQLAAQHITFPAAEALSPELAQYAGQEVTTGPLAKAYSDMIAEHLERHVRLMDADLRGPAPIEVVTPYTAPGDVGRAWR